MARLNYVSLYGFIEDKPKIRVDKETGKPLSAMCYIHVVRGHRDDHSGKKFMKHDFPLIIALNPGIIQEMMTWEPFDIVSLKGTVTTRNIDKPSYCEHCTQPDGSATMNVKKGVLLYVTPIYARKESHCNDKKEAMARIIGSREVSNVVFAFGTLMTDPTFFKTKAGTLISQFKVAIGRKFRITTDSEDIKTDWPWVKTYGKEAEDVKLRLSRGAEIYIDGVIQARTIHRKTKCEHCGGIYHWEDRTLELVPYALEYISGHMTDELLKEKHNMDVDELRKRLLDFKEKDVVEEDANSEDIDESTIAALKTGENE